MSKSLHPAITKIVTYTDQAGVEHEGQVTAIFLPSHQLFLDVAEVMIDTGRESVGDLMLPVIGSDRKGNKLTPDSIAVFREMGVLE